MLQRSEEIYFKFQYLSVLELERVSDGLGSLIPFFCIIMHKNTGKCALLCKNRQKYTLIVIILLTLSFTGVKIASKLFLAVVL